MAKRFDDLDGQSALVTGGSRGLGLAIAQRLAAAGAAVTIADIAPPADGAPEGLAYETLDVTDEAAWQDVLARQIAEQGGLSILVNNAGLDLMPSHDIETLDLAATRTVFDVNVFGTMLGCKHAIPLIAKAGGGSIVNLSSVGGLLPTPFLTGYGASKAAVAHLSRSVALHCAERGYAIRCNSIHPGQIRTPLHQELTSEMAKEAGLSPDQMQAAMLAKIPMGVWQEEPDIAHAVAFLVSAAGRYITGQEIVIDGGMMLSN